VASSSRNSTNQWPLFPASDQRRPLGVIVLPRASRIATGRIRSGTCEAAVTNWMLPSRLNLGLRFGASSGQRQVVFPCRFSTVKESSATDGPTVTVSDPNDVLRPDPPANEYQAPPPAAEDRKSTRLNS